MSSAPIQRPQHHAVGATVAGKYLLSRVIGEGGMGAVYEAEHIELGKRVAIKLVRELRGQQEEVAARFIREARAASAIESDFIVQVYDVGQDPVLGLYMVMECLVGEDLGVVIQRLGKVDAPFACAIADQAAAGLEIAHQAGVIHRDLKPENVFLKRARDDGSSSVKLVDFGIAKLVREANQAASSGGVVTRVGSVIGSPCYMSPEQAQGFSDVDHRTDVYSLGACFYEMLTGQRAFAEKPTYEQTIIPIITQTAPRVSSKLRQVAPKLDKLVADMMHPDPGQRPRDMTEVRRRLSALQPGLDETRIRIPPGPPVRRDGPRLIIESGSHALTLPFGSRPGEKIEDHASLAPTLAKIAVPEIPDEHEADARESVALLLARPKRTAIFFIGVFVAAFAAFLALWLIFGRSEHNDDAMPQASATATVAAPLRPTAAAIVIAAPPPPDVRPAEEAAAVMAAASSSAPVEVTSAGKPRPKLHPKERVQDQVGGVGITTAF